MTTRQGAWGILVAVACAVGMGCSPDTFCHIDTFCDVEPRCSGTRNLIVERAVPCNNGCTGYCDCETVITTCPRGTICMERCHTIGIFDIEAVCRVGPASPEPGVAYDDEWYIDLYGNFDPCNPTDADSAPDVPSDPAPDLEDGVDLPDDLDDLDAEDVDAPDAEDVEDEG